MPTTECGPHPETFIAWFEVVALCVLELSLWFVSGMTWNVNLAISGNDGAVFLHENLGVEASPIRRELCVAK